MAAVNPVPAPGGLPPRLPLALYLAGRRWPQLLVEALCRLHADGPARIVLIILAAEPPPALSWPWRFYGTVDRWLCGRRRRPLQPCDLPAALAGVPVLPFSPAADAPWRQQLAAAAPAAVLRLGPAPAGTFNGLAPHGTWHFDFGEPANSIAGGEGFQAVASGRSLAIIRLSASLDDGQEKLLCQTSTRTLPYSLTLNRARLLRRAAQLPGRALAALRREGTAHWPSIGSVPAPPLSAEPAEPAPLAGGPAMAGMVRRIVRRGGEKLLGIEQWFLAWQFDDGRRMPLALGDYACLLPPPDRFWADPFPLERDGRHFIFFEELPFARGRAHIACAEIGPGGFVSPPRPVLTRPYHLSYPFLIEGDGELFMVPESGMNGTVELYRCRRFPDEWELVNVLLTAPCCADATFHRDEQHWWMFVNIGCDGGDVHDELHLYFADRLDGIWQPHPANPVKCDARGARSAGRLYSHLGQLYRPAQIGTPLYGSGMVLNRVLALDEKNFREEAVARILPPADSPILGVHTINRAGRLSVIDGFTRRPRFGQPRFSRFSPILDIAPQTSHATC